MLRQLQRIKTAVPSKRKPKPEQKRHINESPLVTSMRREAVRTPALRELLEEHIGEDGFDRLMHPCHETAPTWADFHAGTARIAATCPPQRETREEKRERFKLNRKAVARRMARIERRMGITTEQTDAPPSRSKPAFAAFGKPRFSF